MPSLGEPLGGLDRLVERDAAGDDRDVVALVGDPASRRSRRPRPARVRTGVLAAQRADERDALAVGHRARRASPSGWRRSGAGRSSRGSRGSRRCPPAPSATGRPRRSRRRRASRDSASFAREIAAMRTKSYARERNAANVDDERRPAAHLHADRRRDELLLGDEHLEVAVRVRLAEVLGVRRVRDLAVERDDVAADVGQRGDRLAVGLAGRDLVAELVASAARRRASRRRAACPPSGLRDVDRQVALAAELLDRRLGVVERLAVLAGLVLDRLDALALLGLGDDRGRLARGGLGLGVGGLDRVDVVAVDRDRLPAEGLDPAHVAVEVPAEHRLARLAEPVDVDDRRQVVEASPSRRAGRPPTSSPRPSRSRRTAPTRGRAACRARGRPSRRRRRSAGPGRASRWRRRSAGSAASGGPRAASRACGTSAAPRRRSRPTAFSTE